MKVHPFKIPKPLQQSLMVQVDHTAAFYDRLHQHEEIQISGILQGSGKLLVADSIHPYGPGDIVVIGRTCPHVFQSNPSSQPSHMISLFFTRSSFGEGFFDLPEMEQLRRFFDRSEAGFLLCSNRRHLMRMLQCLNRNSGVDRILLLLRLLVKIEQAESRVLTGFIFPNRVAPNEGNRMQVVFDYVIRNFDRDISLKSMGDLANMSTGAFCRFFRQRTNKTFFQFLIELRIEHACQLLSGNRDVSISEIAEMSGFHSVSNFNRKFKSLKGITPTAYFKSMHPNSSP